MLLQTLASFSALVMVVMSGGIALADSVPDLIIPESPAVVQDRTQIPTDINSQSETIDRNTNNTRSDSTERDLPSNSAANVGECGKQ
jgi:hypothetical protein